MQKRYKYFSFLLSLFVLACSEEKSPNNNWKEAVVFSEQKIAGFSSGSGMGWNGQHLFAVGDDDAYLWLIDTLGNAVERYQIWDTINVIDGRISKKSKPDFEALAIINEADYFHGFVFGSGSKSPTRDQLLTFHWKNGKIENSDLSNGNLFFAWLKQTLKLDVSEVNIEGATFTDKHLMLFNRHSNEVYSIPLDRWKQFIRQGDTSFLELVSYRFELPVYQGDTARFSGASSIAGSDKILFSASIEKTEDWVGDGAILGSFVGIISAEDLSQESLVCFPLLLPNGERFIGKLEAVHGFLQTNKVNIYGITDDDDGTTSFLKIVLQ